MSTAIISSSDHPQKEDLRTYEVRTFGCQMNVHDSERLAGMLEAAGYAAVPEGQEPDLVVLNTCAVRENADQRLYGTLGALKLAKRNRPGMQIAVGGCLAQKDKDAVISKAPWVDAVFGTHNLASLPVLLERARVEDEAQVEIAEALEMFPSVLPRNVNPPMRAGCRCQWDATTPARFALFLPCAARRWTAAPVTFWLKSVPLLSRGCAR